MDTNDMTMIINGRMRNVEETLETLFDLVKFKLTNSMELPTNEFIAENKKLVEFCEYLSFLIEEDKSTNKSIDNEIATDEIMDEFVDEIKDPFQVRKDRKGLKKKKPILKHDVNTAVSQTRINGMKNAFKDLGIDEQQISKLLQKELTPEKIIGEDMVYLVDVYREVQAGTPFTDFLRPF